MALQLAPLVATGLAIGVDMPPVYRTESQRARRRLCPYPLRQHRLRKTVIASGILRIHAEARNVIP